MTFWTASIPHILRKLIPNIPIPCIYFDSIQINIPQKKKPIQFLYVNR
jgi:hypothetical protein